VWSKVLKPWEPLGFVIINGDLSLACLGSNIISNPEHLIVIIASPSRHNSEHVNEEVQKNSLGGQVKTYKSVNSTDCEGEERHFSM
jgi:hypothetical protein